MSSYVRTPLYNDGLNYIMEDAPKREGEAPFHTAFGVIKKVYIRRRAACALKCLCTTNAPASISALRCRIAAVRLRAVPRQRALDVGLEPRVAQHVRHGVRQLHVASAAFEHRRSTSAASPRIRIAQR